MLVNFALLLWDVLASVSGQLSLKLAMNQVGAIGLAQVANPIATAIRVFSNPLMWLALALYSTAFIAWLIVLSRINLSLAYPLLALTYVLIPIASWVILGEQVPTLRWVGITIIAVGIVAVGASYYS